MAASAPVSGNPLQVFEAVVAEVRDLSPQFRRITLTGSSLRTFGVPGTTLGLRLTGEGGLMSRLTKMVVESALEGASPRSFLRAYG